ncbi:hypothetical protein K438DRAFT_498258 [Mycena galopus ATCC 62051]|nr:hypothetical protein K438DRAFT_498258 [Mycena galopus ATCC 62051]
MLHNSFKYHKLYPLLLLVCLLARLLACLRQENTRDVNILVLVVRVSPELGVAGVGNTDTLPRGLGAHSHVCVRVFSRARRNKTNIDDLPVFSGFLGHDVLDDLACRDFRVINSHLLVVFALLCVLHHLVVVSRAVIAGGFSQQVVPEGWVLVA